MSVGILLVTHPGIGSSILSCAKRILGQTSLATYCLEVPLDSNIERINAEARGMIKQLDQGDGVLVMCDIFGATPNNIARQFSEHKRVAVLAGLNLPMLLRVYNYADKPLKELCETAVEGGTRGIHSCTLED